MISVSTFLLLLGKVQVAGYGSDIEWAENCKPPQSPEEFAREAIFVICNSGMSFRVAQGIFNRVMEYVLSGRSALGAFRHIGKATAIDSIWHHRADLLVQFMEADDKLVFCERLPWIGAITKYHLAKNFGAQVAKPDVHLQRLADLEACTVQELCERLASATGYKVPTVDIVLWRACAIGLFSSRTGTLKNA